MNPKPKNTPTQCTDDACTIVHDRTELLGSPELALLSVTMVVDGMMKSKSGAT